MKGFDTFDTTNSVYGQYYKKEEDPITNIPKYTKPDDEEKFYQKTLEMRENYFDRYAHLYKDPKNHPHDNPIDARAFKEENQGANKEVPLQRPQVMSHEMPEKEPPAETITQTFRRNYEEKN